MAILRFENLSDDPAQDWMGRAFSQIVTRDLAGAAGVFALPFERLHAGEAGFGVKPAQAPGVSAEHSLALAAGANRIGYGEYWVRADRLEARLSIEDPGEKMVRVLVASAAAGNPLEAADALARQISPQAIPYPTRSVAALEAYVDGLELADARASSLEKAIAADPGFGPPYLLLAEWKAQQRDRGGALALLDQSLSRKLPLPPLERARLAYLAANLRGEPTAAGAALKQWSQANPNDPEVWSALASESTARHEYSEAMQANQKALEAEPGDVNALNQLGYSAAYAGQLDTAMRALRRYQELRPGDANPLDSMGDVNLALGRLGEAAQFYLQAAKRDPAFLNGGEFFKAAMARLMSGDVAGADALAKQFADTRAPAKDPMVDFRRAEWQWASGRRKAGYQQMQAFAGSAESGPARPAASEAYSQLAIWNVALGDRSAAAQMAQKAASIATGGTSNLAAVTLFLAQPQASAEEWKARAERAFPDPSQKQEKDLVLGYALLAAKEFAPAAKALEAVYAVTPLHAEPGLTVLLAWAYLDSGRAKEAAGLLRFNPIPPATGLRPLNVFEFPRIFYLRGRIAALAGNPEQAQSYYKLFSQLSGDQPLMWGEEAAAKR